MSAVTARALSWTEAGMVPDTVIRHGIRRLLERKLAEIHAGDIEAATRIKNDFVEMMNASPVALVPELANEQHYEVPAEFFDEVLGRTKQVNVDKHYNADRLRPKYETFNKQPLFIMTSDER